MADSVVKLKVNSQEYDQKIQRAAQGLRAFIDDCRKSGQSLTEVSSETMQFVQNLGKMPTVADNGMKSIREYTRSITDLTIQFRSLSDEEKKSPFGQALSAGIQQLTKRAGMAKDAMNDVSASIQNVASDTRTFDQLAGAANLAVSGFQTLQGTLKLLGVEMGDDVAVIANLQAAMAVTNGLTEIQTALQKQSAVMQGVMSVQTKAAAVAQSLLAKNTALATAAGKAFNIVAKANPIGLLVTGIGAAVGALSLFTSQNDKLTKELEEQQQAAEEAKKAAEDYQKSLEELNNKTVGNLYAKFVTLKASWESLSTTAEKTQWIKDSTNAFREMGVAIRSVKDAEDIFINNSSDMIRAMVLRARAKVLEKQMSDVLGSEGIYQLENTGEGALSNGKYTLGYSVAENMAKELQHINDETDKLVSKWSARGGGRGGQTGGSNTPKPEVVPEPPAFVPIGSEQYFENAIQSLQKQAKMLPTTSQEYAELKKQIEGVTLAYRIMKGEFDGEIEAKKNALANPDFSDLNEFARQQTISMTDDFQKQAKKAADAQEAAAKKTAQAWQLATQSINQVGSALQGLEDPSAKIAGLIGQAIANIALGFAQAAAKDSKLGVWGWIAAVAGGLTTMVSTISAIHSATGYAQGGIVKGNSYSGDNIGGIVDGSQLVGLDAGELVLTRAMQGNLAQQLEGNGLGNLTLTSKIRGENIIMSINNTSRRRGKGEMVTSKFYR